MHDSPFLLSKGALALGFVALGLFATAQEPTPEPEKAREASGAKPSEQEPPTPKIELPGLDDSQNEMIELFYQVEAKLQEIDKLLYEAGAGAPAGGKLEDSGIDRLLRDAQQRSASVQQGLDRILELARQQNQQSSSSSGGGQPQEQQGPSPLDQQRSQGPQEREKRPQGQTPETPGKQDPSGAQQDPNTPKDSKEDPAQRRGGQPPSGAKGAATPPVDDRERWGELPEQVRDVFRVQGGGDLPPRYRDFIDSYYRRMSKRP